MFSHKMVMNVCSYVFVLFTAGALECFVLVKEVDYDAVWDFLQANQYHQKTTLVRKISDVVKKVGMI